MAAADARAVFGSNLRELSKRARSIAQLCRDIGINRTQFNRYLSGEAFPRPDVLLRLCRFFNVDARILLQSLEELEVEAIARAPDMTSLEPLRRKMLDFDHKRTPDGYYRMVRPIATLPGMSVESLLVLKTRPDGTKAIQAAVPKPYYDAVGQVRTWPERRLSGLVFQHNEGISFLFSSATGRMLQLCYFSGGFSVLANLYTGYAAFTVSSGSRQAQIVPAILEYLGTDYRLALRTRRRETAAPKKTLSRVTREYFQRWTPYQT